MKTILALLLLCSPALASEPIVTGYTATWCQACPAMKPVWKSLERTTTVYVIDVDHPPAWVGSYRPARVPLTTLHVDRRLVRRWEGVVGVRDVLLFVPLDAKP